jgi:hypothetical protein
MLFQVVAGSEGFGAELALEFSRVEMNAHDVSRDSRLVFERFLAPEANELGALMGSLDVGLQSVALVEGSTAEAAAEARCDEVCPVVILEGDGRWDFAAQASRTVSARFILVLLLDVLLLRHAPAEGLVADVALK